MQAADHPALGLIVDSFHTLAVGDDPSGLADLPGDRLFFVQLADAPRLSMDVLSLSRHYRSFPGQGELDVAGFLRAVLASGYAGPLSLEVFNDEFRSAPARMIARDGCAPWRWWRRRWGSPPCRRRRASTGWSSSSSRWTTRAGEVLAQRLERSVSGTPGVTGPRTWTSIARAASTWC